ncbi:hypothetical protein M404DRAFT_998094 [Pisolithus tinctorius Marx 270]|uniref:Uncharacterized protein n=1 Tax=Pisolithus tinctorius Marx 270 TaxID=870435 RepID=A0A0C3PG86_PISTI|nr:hypothetical protein M404DRAFT_998094 [Pisolithus tinctorius Marx 270]
MITARGWGSGSFEYASHLQSNWTVSPSDGLEAHFERRWVGGRKRVLPSSRQILLPKLQLNWRSQSPNAK